MKRFIVAFVTIAFVPSIFPFYRSGPGVYAVGPIGCDAATADALPESTMITDMTQESPSQESEAQEPRPGPERPDRRETTPQIKPYDQVITKEAKSDEGVLTVHRIREKVYYEIPQEQLNKAFLWVSQIARTTLGVGYGGQAVGNRVVRWERYNNRVLLRNVSYEIVANPSLPIARAVGAANNDTIIMSFNIEALGKDEAPVIETTKLFTTEVPEFSARMRLRARGFDTSRALIENIVSFPGNIEVRVSHTFTAPPEQTPSQGGRPAPPSRFGPTGMQPGSATVLMHYSMVKLPEDPMMPRLYDERVGYFTVRLMDYGLEEHRAPQRRYITRWRLEKKDPNGDLSDPIKPIVYYIDPATPSKWVPFIKRGVEKWQEAFEEAGFRNAILAKDAPSPEEDPDWHPEDARYSVIRWLPSTIENAMGPHIHDPRTGEILESDIHMYHNIMNLQRSWYFLQAGPLDPRVQKLPMPDDLMGTLIEYVVAHEVGHTLGFQHNMKASSLYPIEKIRDREWVKTMGHTPTLMDYSRFNYVAQPEDGIDPDDLVPQIGPYDKWATMWGYKPVSGALTPDDEKPTLDRWARIQDQTPWLRFSTAGSRGSDPGELTEAVGDANAIEATALGIRNLQRVAEMLLPATEQPGEPYNDLEELYGRMLGQWVLELNHVAAIVGGFNSQQKHGGQQGVRFEPVPKERQVEAVKFLNQQAFTTPTWAIKPEILRRIEPTGVLNRIRMAQQRVLSSLLSNPRFARLVEQAAMDGSNAYGPIDFLADLRKGIWSELDSPKVQIDAYRRNLQRTYLELLRGKLNGPQAVTDDQRPIIRGELHTLDTVIRRRLVRVTDRATQLHLEDVRDQIARILDPKFAPPSAPEVTTTGRPDADLESDPFDVQSPKTCWPDYVIQPPKD